MNQAEVRKLFNYNPDTGILTNRITRTAARAGKEAGTVHSEGYRRVAIHKKIYSVASIIWLYIHGKWPDGIIDHTDGIRDNNRIFNLCDCTRQQNSRNCKKSKTNTSGVTGVCWDKDRNKWKASITVSYKHKGLGSFDTIELATYARKAAEIKYGFNPNHGRHANAGEKEAR